MKQKGFDKEVNADVPQSTNKTQPNTQRGHPSPSLEQVTMLELSLEKMKAKMRPNVLEDGEAIAFGRDIHMYLICTDI